MEHQHTAVRPQLINKLSLPSVHVIDRHFELRMLNTSRVGSKLEEECISHDSSLRRSMCSKVSREASTGGAMRKHVGNALAAIMVFLSTSSIGAFSSRAAWGRSRAQRVWGASSSTSTFREANMLMSTRNLIPSINRAVAAATAALQVRIHQ